MKINVPAREIEVCDVCQRTDAPGPLTTCNTCGREYCLTCNAIIPRCWFPPDVCRRCSGREDVGAIVIQYSDEITPIISRRTNALKALNNAVGRSNHAGS